MNGISRFTSKSENRTNPDLRRRKYSGSKFEKIPYPNARIGRTVGGSSYRTGSAAQFADPAHLDQISVDPDIVGTGSENCQCSELTG
jgi:hypothetical protein